MENPIRFKTIIEVLGKPKEHVEKTLKGFVEQIEQDNVFHVMKKDFAEPKEVDKMWAAFVEMEIIVQKYNDLFGFCIDYMPSSVEIIKPDKLEFASAGLTTMITDLQGKLHNIDMIAKQLRQENQFLKRNMNNMVENSIKILLQINVGDIKRLSEATGIPEEELKIILDRLEKEGKIIKDSESYKLVK